MCFVESEGQNQKTFLPTIILHVYWALDEKWKLPVRFSSEGLSQNGEASIGDKQPLRKLACSHQGMTYLV